MLQTLALTGPIYLVIALGYLAVHRGIMSKPDMRVLGTFVMRFALPALIFTALSQRPVRDILDLHYLLNYLGGSLIVMFGAFAWGYWRQRKSFTHSALCGLGMASSNSGYIGYPIAVLAVGASEAAVGLAQCMIVENLVMIPLAMMMADSGHAGGGRWQQVALQSAKQLLRNPVILAMLGGIFVATLSLPISGVLARTINMLALSSTGPSLFVIGGTLVGLSTRGMRRDVSAIALGKLALHPGAIGLMMWLMPPDDPALRAAGVVYASVPMLSIYPIIAQKYGFEGLCAASLMLATILSFLTISIALWVLGPLLGWAPGLAPGH